MSTSERATSSSYDRVTAPIPCLAANCSALSGERDATAVIFRSVFAMTVAVKTPAMAPGREDAPPQCQTAAKGGYLHIRNPAHFILSHGSEVSRVPPAPPAW